MTGIMDRFNTIFTFFNAFGYTVRECDKYYGVEAVNIGHEPITFVDTQIDGDDPISELAGVFCKMYDVSNTATHILEQLFNIYKNGGLPEHYSRIFGAKHSEMAFMLMAHAREVFDDDIDVVEFLDNIVGIIHGELMSRTQSSLNSKMDDYKNCNICDNYMCDKNINNKVVRNNPITPVKDIMFGMGTEKIDLNVLKRSDEYNKITDTNIECKKEENSTGVKIENKQPEEVKKPINKEQGKKRGPKYISDKVFTKHKYVNVPIQITYRLKSDDDMFNRFDFGYITNKGSIKSLYSTNDNEERFIISISILPMTVQELKQLLKK